MAVRISDKYRKLIVEMISEGGIETQCTKIVSKVRKMNDNDSGEISDYMDLL